MAADAPGWLVGRRLKNAKRSPGVMLRTLRLVLRRQRRDSATASKVFFLVAMDAEGWHYDAHGWLTAQAIDGVEPGFTAALLPPES